MSRGYDSFDLDDFGRFAPERSHEKSQRREYPESGNRSAALVFYQDSAAKRRCVLKFDNRQKLAQCGICDR